MPPEDLIISEDDYPEMEAVNAIQRGLHAFNQEMGGPYDREPVTVLARDAAGEVQGGLDRQAHKRSAASEASGMPLVAPPLHTSPGASAVRGAPWRTSGPPPGHAPRQSGA